jgi:hypothetical protein
VTPEHFEEAVVYGVFFAVAAAAQLGWALLMCLRPQRWTVLAGLVGNAAMVALWAVTRTVGVPLGPGAGTTEEIGGLDIAATGFELTLVVAVSLIVLRSRRSAASVVRHRHDERLLPVVG